MMKTIMIQLFANEYKSSCGLSLRREYGLTPNGNEINGRWVLRDKDGNFLDFGTYRNDLCEHHNLEIYVK